MRLVGEKQEYDRRGPEGKVRTVVVGVDTHCAVAAMWYGVWAIGIFASVPSRILKHEN